MNVFMPKTFSTTLHNKGGPIPKAYRDHVKQKFLDAMAETNRVTVACRQAGITRMTARAWMISGYVSEEELEECYLAYTEHVKNMIATNMFVHGRIVHPEDMWECVPTRRLWMIAKATVPEFGGRPRAELRFSTSGWTYTEIMEIRERIIEIQAKHRQK